LEWLPQGNIFFPGAKVTSETRVALHGDARFIGWQVDVLGRPVIGERFERGAADLALTLSRDGRPLIAERLRVAGERDLVGPAGLRGYAVCAALFAGPAVAADLEAARRVLPTGNEPLAAATLVDGLVVVRCLGSALEPVTRTLIDLWASLRPRLLQRAPCAPRIWAT
jgi:urease accessory protein